MFALVASFSYVIAPVADVRDHPSNDSEVVSQVYFSESVRVLEEQGIWLKIKNVVDGYEGWLTKEALCSREDTFLPPSTHTIAKVDRLCAHIYNKQDTVYGFLLSLPFESRLRVLDSYDSIPKNRWIKVSLPDGREGYIQRGDVLINPPSLSMEDMCLFSKRFLNIPYVHGGRTSFGYDCSGFVQMLYRQIGVFLPRDARDQVNSSLLRETSLEKLSPGDLIFFGPEKSKILHVGMYLGEDRFIHSTVAENAPYIHVSVLSSKEWNGLGKYPYRTFRTLVH